MKYRTTQAIHTEQDIWQEFNQHSKSFSFATRLLPRPVQYPISVLYYYCRFIDTIADEKAPVIGKKAALQELLKTEEALKETLSGNPPDGILWMHLAKINQKYPLNQEAMLELIEGARWDLTEKQINNEADLLHYCNLVGGCVGVMMLPFLVKNPADIPRLTPTARALGNAFQITNILRDVGEDLQTLGRIYLPQSLCKQYGINVSFLESKKVYHGYPDLLEHLMEKAESLYKYSFEGIHALHFQARLGITIATRIYREIQNEVRMNRYNNLTKRAFVPQWRKAQLLFTNPYYKRKTMLKKQV